jgi:uncharacterized membrane protein
VSKETIVFISGILLIIVPFLGIPLAWRAYAIAALGVLLVFVGYAQRRAVYLKQIERDSGERATDSFVETTDKLFDDNKLQ